MLGYKDLFLVIYVFKVIICLSTSIDRGAFKLANEGKRLRTFEKHFFVQRAFANRHKCLEEVVLCDQSWMLD